MHRYVLYSPAWVCVSECLCWAKALRCCDRSVLLFILYFIIEELYIECTQNVLFITHLLLRQDRTVFISSCPPPPPHLPPPRSFRRLFFSTSTNIISIRFRLFPILLAIQHCGIGLFSRPPPKPSVCLLLA